MKRKTFETVEFEAKDFIEVFKSLFCERHAFAHHVVTPQGKVNIYVAIAETPYNGGQQAIIKLRDCNTFDIVEWHEICTDRNDRYDILELINDKLLEVLM